MPTPLQQKLSALAALIAGLLLPLAFAPFNVVILGILCPAFLLFLWLNASSPRQAFLTGGLFGLGFFGIGISWVYVSLHVYGHANVFVATIITGLLIIFLAFFIAAQGYLFIRYFSSYPLLSKTLLIFPIFWVLGECARTWLLTGFPWLFLGYSQMHSPLRGLAPLLSVYAVSWAVAFTSGALVSIFLVKKDYKTLLPIITPTLTLWLISFMLTYVHWTQPEGKPFKVSLIQGNIPTELKWQLSQTQITLNTFQRLTEQHLDSQIIVWPEAAITLPHNQAKDYLDPLSQTLQSHHTTLITGIPITEDGKAYNGMIAVGDGEGAYRKRHLVPFGEYMPFRSVLMWLDDYLQIPMSDFSSGPKKQPLLMAKNLPIAAYICYEIAYPTEVLDSLPQGQLIVTISDDSWFGKSIAPPQHLQIAQMRALETGRYLLMSTNDGLTAIINPQGKVVASLPPFQEGVLTGNIQAMSGSTPWVYILKSLV